MFTAAVEFEGGLGSKGIFNIESTRGSERDASILHGFAVTSLIAFANLAPVTI